MRTPVLFIIFNRPAVTRRVFQAIRQARPAKLYVAADGPRAQVPGDAAACAETRRILEGIDWECEVKLLFREKNLGCKVAVSTALDWFFLREEEGIVLEDDCLPDPSFFGYCSELLERYRDVERVMMISGDNFQYGRVRGEGSYYFSRFSHIWGWASWRRAWSRYDVSMGGLPRYLERDRIAEIVERQEERDYWLHSFVRCYQGEIDTWDYQWTFSMWEHDGVSILPNVNLVTNIGFGPDAVHCQNADSLLANLPVRPIGDLRHPSRVEPDREADRFTFDYTYLGKTDASGAIVVPEQIPQDPQGTEPMITAAQTGSTYETSREALPVELAAVPRTTAAGTAGVAQLKASAEVLLGQGKVAEALEQLIRAKQLKSPLAGVDQLRALCFLRLGQPLGGVEALREELRYFPDNGEASRMLAELQSQMPEDAYGSCGTDNAEFRELLAAIRPFTMLSEQRLFSLYTLARTVCENDLPGNFVECGVAAGGSSALLAFVIKKYSRQPRRLFSFDSFSGMPKPGELDSHQGLGAEATGWGTGTCAAPEESVRQICSRLGVSELVTTVKGYFQDTLPQMRDWVGMLGFLHLDGDWYQSTRDILENLYDRLLPGALLQVDDYGYWDGCRKAIHEFEAQRGLSFTITGIDGTGVWFKKPDGFPVNPRVPQGLIDEFFADDPVRKGIISQMSTNERFQLYYALRQELAQRPLTRVVEIGSFSGASLLLTHQALVRRGGVFQGICVEPGGTGQFHEIVKILARDVVHLPMLSNVAARHLAVMCEPDRLPDFIFVDGDHTYPGVRQDILDFYPLLAPGGIMMFHDYLPALDDENRAFILNHHGNAEPGIRRAVQELMEDTYACERIELPLLYPSDPTQTQAQLPIIPGVYSTVRAYRKPL
jgi:predicted O-methyltransferase YrrM